MKNNTFLVLIQSNNIDEIKKIKNVRLVYPLKFFSVGLNSYFDIEDIPEDGYIFINKALNNHDIQELSKILNGINIRGIIFEDLGVLDLIQGRNIEKILFQPHQLANYLSIEAMLGYVDSVLLTTDITKHEINEILDRIPNKLGIYGLGYLSIMYSKRKLLSNYFEKYHLPPDKELSFSTNDKEIKGIESEDGTVLYENKCYMNSEFVNDKRVIYTFINSLDLNNKDIIDYINNGKVSFETTPGFLNEETIYKVKGGE